MKRETEHSDGARTGIVEFPFRSMLSLEPLVRFWADLSADVDSPAAPFAASVVERARPVAALEGPVPDPSVLEPHLDVLDLLLTAVFPLAAGEELPVAVVPPFGLRSVFATPAAERIGLFTGDGHTRANLDQKLIAVGKTIQAYNFLLQQFYGISTPVDYPVVLAAEEESGLTRYFKLDFDTRFVRAQVRGALPSLDSEHRSRLLAEPTNLELWMELLPPSHFEFHGFTVVTAVDVTLQEVLSLLKHDLLDREALTAQDRFSRLQDRVRTLLRRPDVELGLICLPRGNGIDAIREARAIGRSLLLSGPVVPCCPKQTESHYARAFEGTEPVIVYDLTRCDVCTGFEQHLLDQGFRSLLVFPLRLEDEMVGLLEVASPRPGDLNALDALRLWEVVALFATAMKRTLSEQEDRVQAVIKQQYTAIHPVVEWRFREAALEYLHRSGGEKSAPVPEVTFPDVYPLYGLSDLRNSSVFRAAAIQADLVAQLELASDVLLEAARQQPFPVLDELSYRIHRYVERVERGLRSEDETSVLDFLRTDVEPLFPRLRELDGAVAERVDRYQEALDPVIGVLYRERRDFEASVARLNETIAACIEAEEARAQEMFPHYFERFETDGVDFSLYVGQSLVPDRTFDRMHLRNLRLWQLMLMCRVEWAVRAVLPELPVALEATHLVLVQDAPLSIRFRPAEKQFDVDGAYNVRYEIVKKRIDKARIRGTRERLTQPGAVAIVFGQQREAEEYKRYVEYLQAVGFLEPGADDVELEDAQGVRGLRAIRVRVAAEAPGPSSAEAPRLAATALRESPTGPRS